MRDEERAERDKEKTVASEHSDKQADLIEKMAMKQTSVCYHLVWSVLPAFALLIGIAVSILLAIGIFGNADNNLTVQLIEWSKTTPLGAQMSALYDYIVPAAIGLAVFTLGYSLRTFFSFKRKEKRKEYTKRYLEKMQA